VSEGSTVLATVGETPTAPGRPLLAYRTNDDLVRAAEQQAAEEQRRQQESKQVQGIAGLIRQCFAEAEQHRVKMGITDRLLKCQRQKQGQYEPDKAALIQAQGGCQTYFNITETKCEALQSWIRDVISPVAERSWSLSPSPLPSLPNDPEMLAEVEDTVVTQANRILQAGQQLDQQTVKRLAMEEYDKRLADIVKEAQRRAKRMEEKMADQLAEGGFYDSMDGFYQDLAMFPLAILKGPVVRPVKRLRWEQVENGRLVPNVTTELIPTWTSVSPFDFFWSPNARSVHDGYICEKITVDRATLAAQKQAPGYSAAAIDAVLTVGAQATGALSQEITGEQARAELENRDQTTADGNYDAMIEGIEFWGSISGKILLDWDGNMGAGGRENIRPTEQYEVCAILLGDYVVRLVLNPDPLDQRPYHVTSYIKVKNSLCGRAVPEKMSDCQDAYNGCHRNAHNAMAMASGPQTAIDTSMCHATSYTTPIFPWKRWLYDGKANAAAGGRLPVEFFQPRDNSRAMIENAGIYENAADDRTMIPKYTYGNENIGGAGQTASGLAMLMSAAARGVKRVIGAVDADVLRKTLGMLYTWNMLYLGPEYDPLKGDAFIVPEGVLKVLVKEQEQQRLREFMRDTMNPTDQAIIGMRGRANMLRRIAQQLNIPVADIIENDPELLARTNQSLAQQLGGAAPSPAGTGMPPGAAPEGQGAPAAAPAPMQPQQLPIQPAE
jgi:hypothetical protein